MFVTPWSDISVVINLVLLYIIGRDGLKLDARRNSKKLMIMVMPLPICERRWWCTIL
jgi:hypothetical protein